MSEFYYLDKALIEAIEERDQKFLEARGSPERTRELLKEVLKDPRVKQELKETIYEPKKPLNSVDNPPTCLMDIVDEAYELIDNRVDFLRNTINFRNHYYERGEDISNLDIKNEMEFLKDIRNLLKLSDNFRDEEFEGTFI